MSDWQICSLSESFLLRNILTIQCGPARRVVLVGRSCELIAILILVRPEFKLCRDPTQDALQLPRRQRRT